MSRYTSVLPKGQVGGRAQSGSGSTFSKTALGPVRHRSRDRTVGVGDRVKWDFGSEDGRGRGAGHRDLGVPTVEKQEDYERGVQEPLRAPPGAPGQSTLLRYHVVAAVHPGVAPVHRRHTVGTPPVATRRPPTLGPGGRGSGGVGPRGV